VASVRLQAITKQFGAVHVIRKVDLTIADGAFTVFVGPSGCGKSTLLRIIAGLETASSGQLLIGQRDHTRTPPADREVAMVFQSYALYPHMTVAENLTFGMRMRGVAKSVIADKLARAVSILRLSDYLNRRPGELSGGQCQRVAIGRALVQEPAVFLFDEPLSNLDAELRLAMRVEIKNLHRELKTTMIYVTHDQVEAMTLADQIVVLRAGAIEQVGAPLTLYHQPANTFVAGFIGSPTMNLWSAAAVAHVAPPQEATHFGVRPEHLTLTRQGDSALRFRVQTIEALGGTAYLYGSLPTGERVCAELRDVDLPQCGDEVGLALTSGRGHWFDAQGQAVAA
jgi:lactose/L-arabinose transport system ATP-binding protein